MSKHNLNDGKLPWIFQIKWKKKRYYCGILLQVEVSPLENGIYVVENKNHELRTLICQYQHKQLHGNINLLSMCLNGMIDAAVNGGIARYQEVKQGQGQAIGTDDTLKESSDDLQSCPVLLFFFSYGILFKRTSFG